MKYIISEDVNLLAERELERLGSKGKIAPVFFEGLRKRLKKKLGKIFGEEKIEFIPAKEIRNGMENLIKEAAKKERQPVFLDRVYFPKAELHLDITRSVDESLQEKEETERFFCLPIKNQIKNLSDKMKEIILADDVIFSGKGAVKVINLCREQGIEVKTFIAGISIGEGKERIEKEGVLTQSVLYFEKVIDEICERDFFAGMPMSGRNVLHQKRNTGAPYFLPFGNPNKWASIPKEAEEDFSRFCLKQSVEIWEEIGRIREKPVKCGEIERLPIRAPQNGEYFTDYLKSLL
ncbi:MAG: hypothetical protein PHZ25_02280 [Candidatus Pacebacteria bacterium]|nr:hypothetical protein [Candidatus Paceibacterota bacterium]